MHLVTENQKQPQQGTSLDTAKASVGPVAGSQLHPLLHLQSRLGNQGMLRLLRATANGGEAGSGNESTARVTRGIGPIAVQAKLPKRLQPKRTVSAPGDIHEQEAERLSEQVLRMPDSEVSTAAALPQISRKCTTLGDEEQTLQTRPTGSAETVPGEAPGIVHEVLRSPGQPLDAPHRAFFEPRFGHDFSQVRVHTDLRAAAAARGVAAQAFTVGEHVVFGEGQYAPESARGRHLLAHELTHVVQQRTGGLALQRRASNCPNAPPYPPTIKTMADFIDLVRRVEASTMTGGNPLATARLIFRTKYEGRAWDWLLPSTKGQPGVSKDPYDVGQVTADDVASLCFKLYVALPDGGYDDPMHIIAAIVADAETQAAGTGASGLAKFVDPLPASVTQRGVSTWVGDVGKAAAEWMTAHPLLGGGEEKPDYMRENASAGDLMADVDGVAITSKSAGSGFALDKTKTLSDNLQRYFTPAKRTGRERRFHIFCSVEGFTLEADGVTLTKSAKATIGQQIKDFAEWYEKNDPTLLKWVALTARSYQMSKAFVERAGDWQWFADEFIDFVQKGLTAEGR
jgi:hypothetical protein